MSANNEEVKSKARLIIYVRELQGARVTHSNNAVPLTAAPGRFFANPQLKTEGEPIMQKPKIEGLKK